MKDYIHARNDVLICQMWGSKSTRFSGRSCVNFSCFESSRESHLIECYNYVLIGIATRYRFSHISPILCVPVKIPSRVVFLSLVFVFWPFFSGAGNLTIEVYG